jgi:hypothetical protein
MSGSAELLKLLGSGARAAGLAGRAGLGPVPGAPGIEHADFSALLKKAQAGDLSSHLPVTVDKSANITLTDEELAGLSLVADRAEAAGVRSALVMFPDKSVVLDVQTRRVTATPDVSADVLTGVDGVIRIPAAGGGGAAVGVSTLTSGAMGNASVARLLEAMGQGKKQTGVPAAA